MAFASIPVSWESLAVCRGQNSTLFFPPIAGESSVARFRRERAAKQICSQCPVRQECSDYALRVEEPFGIWDGLNETERREMASPLKRD